MYPISDRFKAALRNSHTVVSRVELLRQGEVLVSDVPVLAGSVTDDQTALIRRRCNVTIAPTSEVLAMLGEFPTDNTGLWPLGNELKLYGGIRFADDGTDDELVPMGVYRISRPQLTDESGELGVSIEGFDRGRAVSRAKFTNTYSIANGTNTATAIENLVRSRLSWLLDADFEFMTTSYTTPSMVLTMDDDPWEIAQDLALGMGAELFFDGNGKCILRPVPDPTFSDPIFDYMAGEEAVLVSVTRDLNDEEAYNGVIMVSEHPDLTTPLRAEAWDLDMASPTYYDPANPETSVYGAVPIDRTSKTIKTQAQCNEAAAIELRHVIGIVDHIDFTAVNNPAHEAGDMIAVHDPTIGVHCDCILQAVTIGIGEQFTMSGSTRQRRITP